MTYKKLKPTDTMIINRGENSYQVSVADAKSGDKLKPDDQFLVNRGANSYRISKADLDTELGPDLDTNVTTPTFLAPVDGAGDLVTAESDVIVVKDVTTTPKYSDEISGPERLTAYPKEHAFDGDESTISLAENGNTMVWTAGPEFSSTTELTVWYYCAAQTDNSGLLVNGVELFTIEANGAYSETVSVASVQSISWKTWSGSQYVGVTKIAIDGVVLLDNNTQTILTFASDKQLSVFEPGDNVQQDSNYDAESDTITNVDPGYTPTTTRYFTSATLPKNKDDVLANATELTPVEQRSLVPTEYLIVVPSGLEKDGQQVFEVNGTAGFTARSDKNAGHFAANGDRLAGTGDYNSSEWVKQEFSNIVAEPYCVPFKLGGYTVFRVNGGTNGTPRTSSGTKLTLAGDKDLDVFKAGDTIQQLASKTAIITVTTSDPDATSDGVKYILTAANGTNKEIIDSFYFAQVGTFEVQCYVYAPGSTDVDLSGKNLDNPGTQTLISGYAKITFEINAPGWVRVKSNTGSYSGTWIFYYLWYDIDSRYVTLNGVKLTDESNYSTTVLTAEVTKVGPGNQIVVDGGEWFGSDGTGTVGGETTVKGSYEPATGVVDLTNPSGPTMSLAISDETYPKRWVANQGKFVKGEEKPSKDAAPDPNVTFRSDAFASTPEDNLKHESTDWQIFAKSDVGNTTPLQQSINDTENLTAWKPPETLDPQTAYKARVRYKSQTGVLSDWGQSVFKTKKFDPSSKVWSDGCYKSKKDMDDGGWDYDKQTKQMFNGIVDSSVNDNGWYFHPSPTSNGCVWDASMFPEIPKVCTVTVHVGVNDPNSGGTGLWVNDIKQTVPENFSGSMFGDIVVNVTDGLQEIRAFDASGASYIFLMGVSIDGQMLINSSVRITQFYDENIGRPMAEINLMSHYGVDPTNDPAAAYRLGIYPIIPQADGYGVSHYVKEGSAYRAIAYPYSIEEQQTMNMIRVAKVKAEDLQNWLNEKRKRS